MRKEITRSIIAMLLAFAFLFVTGADVYATSTVSENEMQQTDPAVTSDTDAQADTTDAEEEETEEETEDRAWFNGFSGNN